MEMIQRITPKEMEMMKAYIETYGDVDGDGCIVTAEMSYILRFWNEQKAALGRLFEDKLILTRNVNITKPHDILTQEVRDNCLEWGSEGRAFYSDFCDWAREKYSRGDIDYSTKDNLFSLVTWQLMCIRAILSLWLRLTALELIFLMDANVVRFWVN